MQQPRLTIRLPSLIYIPNAPSAPSARQSPVSFSLPPPPPPHYPRPSLFGRLVPPAPATYSASEQSEIFVIKYIPTVGTPHRYIDSDIRGGEKRERQRETPASGPVHHVAWPAPFTHVASFVPRSCEIRPRLHSLRLSAAWQRTSQSDLPSESSCFPSLVRKG